MARRRAESASQIELLRERIGQVESDLHMARRTIISMAPDALQKVLLSFYGCESRDQSQEWDVSAAQLVISAATAKPANEMGEYLSTAPRAFCPLCGKGTQNPYGGEGFAIPEGLARHLHGSNHAGQCKVFSAALALADEVFLHKFG